METIIQIDQALFLLLNSWHNTYMDLVMSIITNTWAWVPVLVPILIYLTWKRGIAQTLWVLGGIICCVILGENLASTVLKPLVGRLRPCHDESLSFLVHTVVGCGGKHAWPSAHATNTFMLTSFVTLLLKLKLQHGLFWILCTYAVLVSYSRIYVGVHYPLDVLSGAVIGFGVAYIVYRGMIFVRPELIYLRV